MGEVLFLNGIPDIEQTPLEVIERKGIGHPDTLADGAAEAASIGIVSYWLHAHGGIPHYNLDQVWLTGGEINVDFMGGELIRPTTLYVGGHVSSYFGGYQTHSANTALVEAEEYVRSVLPYLPERALVAESKTTDAARDLFRHQPLSLSDLPDAIDPIANDTSTVVAYWPLSQSEALTGALEGFFYEEADGPLPPQPRINDVGQDIKVMTRRLGADIRVAMSVPLLSEAVGSSHEYHARIEELEAGLNDYAQEFVDPARSVHVRVNPERRRGSNAFYLLNYGSCIESGEEGAVGRGNKQHGLISTERRISMEAPAGKNTANFTGKVGTYYAGLIARILSESHENATVQVIYSANMGDRLKDPSLIAVESSVPIGNSAIRQAVQAAFETNHVRAIQDGYFMPSVFMPSNAAFPGAHTSLLKQTA